MPRSQKFTVVNALRHLNALGAGHLAALYRIDMGHETFSIDHTNRLVTMTTSQKPGGVRHLEMKVPALFGDIEGVDLRGDFVVVRTANGRVSFHADTPRRVSDVTWRANHPLAGKIRSDNVIVASVALVDRRLSDLVFGRIDPCHFDHSLWKALYHLRSSYNHPDGLPQ